MGYNFKMYSFNFETNCLFYEKE